MLILQIAAGIILAAVVLTILVVWLYENQNARAGTDNSPLYGPLVVGEAPLEGGPDEHAPPSRPFKMTFSNLSK